MNICDQSPSPSIGPVMSVLPPPADFVDDRNVRTGEKTAEEINAMLAKDAERREKKRERKKGRHNNSRPKLAAEDLLGSGSSHVEEPRLPKSAFKVGEDNVDDDPTSWRPMLLGAGNTDSDGWVPKTGVE